MAIKVTKLVKQHFFTKCTHCLTEFYYDAEDLGYRPWYSHGFVYCPRCKRPIRHNPEKNVRR